MAKNCLEPRCASCPLNQLDGMEFSYQDRLDGLNSVILISGRFNEVRDTRFESWENAKLARDIGNLVGTRKEVSEIAVRAIEKQVTARCETLRQGEE